MKKAIVLCIVIGMFFLLLFSFSCQKAGDNVSINDAPIETEPADVPAETTADIAKDTVSASEDEVSIMENEEDLSGLDFGDLHKMGVEALMAGKSKNTPVHSEEERAEAVERIKDAIRYCTLSIELNPKSPWPFYTRGEAYLALEDVDKARADFKQACDMGLDQGCVALDKL